MTIDIGIWIFPLFITVLMFVIAGPIIKDRRILPIDIGANFGVIDFNFGIRFVIIYGAVILASAMAWGIYLKVGIN